MSQEEIEFFLDKAKTKPKDEIESLGQQITEIQGVLSGYGKFGDNINLETDDE